MAYRDPSRLTCPRCPEVALGAVVVAGITRHTCSRCGGVWIDDVQLGELLHALGIEADEPLGPLTALGIGVACVRCGNPTAHERAYRAPIEVDVCADHGVWFDRDELAPVLQSLQEEVMARAPDPRSERAGGGLGALLIDALIALGGALKGPRTRPTRTRGRSA